MQVPQIRSPRVKEIIDHADVLFRAERNTLDKNFHEALRAGRSAARETHNAGALVPAEAKCYFARNRDLIVGSQLLLLPLTRRSQSRLEKKSMTCWHTLPL